MSMTRQEATNKSGYTTNLDGKKMSPVFLQLFKWPEWVSGMEWIRGKGKICFSSSRFLSCCYCTQWNKERKLTCSNKHKLKFIMKNKSAAAVISRFTVYKMSWLNSESHWLINSLVSNTFDSDITYYSTSRPSTFRHFLANLGRIKLRNCTSS